MAPEFYSIVFAAIIGSVIGSVLDVRLLGLVFSVPFLVLLQWALIQAAPFLKTSESLSPEMRDSLVRMSAPGVFAPMVVAGAAGALFAAWLVRYLKRGGRMAVLNPRAAARLQMLRADERRTMRNEVRFGPADGEAPAMAAVRRPAPAPAAAIQSGPAEPQFHRDAPAPAPVSAPAPAPAAALPVNNKRRQSRRRSALAGRLCFEDQTSVGCLIQNLSVTGAQILMPSPRDLPRTLRLIDVSHGLGHDAELIWSNEAAAGLRFTSSYNLHEPQTDQARALAQLWREHRKGKA